MTIRAIICAVLASAGPAAAAPLPGVAWDWQLSGPVSAPRVAVFDTDPDSVTAAQVAALNASGIYTICYVSVGTVEKDRDDRAAFPASAVGRIYGDWPDERFLDVRALDLLLPLMKARFQRCKAMGFAAVEPDNMDGFENRSGFPLTATDAVRYVTALAGMAHGMGLEIGQKNVPDLTADLIAHMDFAIAESCYQDGWCNLIAAYTRAGKPVFDAEYNDRNINWTGACAQAATLGISMILKDRDLHAGRRTCE